MQQERAASFGLGRDGQFTKCGVKNGATRKDHVNWSQRAETLPAKPQKMRRPRQQKPLLAKSDQTLQHLTTLSSACHPSRVALLWCLYGKHGPGMLFIDVCKACAIGEASQRVVQWLHSHLSERQYMRNTERNRANGSKLPWGSTLLVGMQTFLSQEQLNQPCTAHGHLDM